MIASAIEYYGIDIGLPSLWQTQIFSILDVKVLFIRALLYAIRWVNSHWAISTVCSRKRDITQVPHTV
ncbi:MAG: hypothetical protein MJE68_12290, partial [Proteobacteria bacterium]|nr:hypothetical protein [Pseudomonadota bacterium]